MSWYDENTQKQFGVEMQYTILDALNCVDVYKTLVNGKSARSLGRNRESY